MIVDAHVHLLPGRLAEKVRAFFDVHMDDVHRPLAYPLDHRAIVASLAGDGVDAVWTLPYAHKPGVAVGLNEAARGTVEALGAGPVRVVGGATVHPGDDDPVAVVTDAIDRCGLRVLKLHCSVGSFDADDARLDGVYRLAAERRLPIVVHLGHAASGHTERAELGALRRVLERHPSTRFVLAHCGHHAAHEALALMDEHAALHADLVPVGRDVPELSGADLAPRADRILFGSDAPNTPLTAGAGIARIRAYGLDPGDEAAVLGANALRLESEVLAG